jgi:DNA-binding GntR family transcriptional regulator
MSISIVESSLRTRAYEHVKSQLFNGALQPGARLSPVTIAREIGTSHIPVREALSQLQREGLIEQIDGRGAFVRAFTRREIANLYDLRIALEGDLAATAARRIRPVQLERLREVCDEMRRLSRVARDTGAVYLQRAVGRELVQIDAEFHRVIHGAAGNPLASRVLADSHALYRLFSVSSRIYWPDFVREIAIALLEHWRLYRHLLSGDAVGAKRCMRGQLRHARRRVLDALERASLTPETRDTRSTSKGNRSRRAIR